MTRWFSLLLAAVSLLLAGCQTTRYIPGKPLTGDALIDGREAIEHGPARDKVLWEYRTALEAMRRGENTLAKQYLDDALARIGGIYSTVKDKDAKQARGYFHSESKKTFIGEPYERVMAYYYRGILFWMEGQPDNARACFRNGQIQDSDTENKTYAADYIMLDYLDGFVTAKLGGDGLYAYKRALALSKSEPSLPPYNLKANVLFFIDFGTGPIKYATGEYAQELRFRAAAVPIRSARVRVVQQTALLPPYDDLYYQATTRGGRVMDHILGNKAVFKGTTDAVGTAAIISGAVLAGGGRGDTRAAGFGVLAAGIVSKVLSASTTPEADTRMWDNLPQYLTFTAMELPPGQHTVTVEFLDSANHLVANLTKMLTVNVPENGGEKVIYVSDRSKSPQTL